MAVGENELRLASKESILMFFNHPINGRCGSVGGKEKHIRQDRRLDGRQFIPEDGSTTKSRTLESALYPIGLLTDKSIMGPVDGSSDILATYALIHAEELKHEVALVPILGPPIECMVMRWLIF
jgi:hypothetical protein